MDGQKLASLLQESQIPDTARIKAITAELQKNYYAHPQSLLLLIEIVCTHSDAGVRQQAAVQAARLVQRHWKAPTADQKASVRKHLMEATLAEQNLKCRHSDAHLVAAIATIDCEDGEWPDLLPALFTLATDTASVARREIGSYILYSTLEANPLIYRDYIAKLLQLFAELIKDPGSADVQINTVLSIGALLLLIDNDDDDDKEAAAFVRAVHDLVPQISVVLKNCVDAGDDDKIQQVFDVLQQFLVYDPAFIGNHLKSLVQFMLDLSLNRDLDDEVRIQALSFLTQTVHYRRLKIQAMRDVPAQLVVKSIEILTEIGDDEAFDEENPGHLALSLLDALSSELPQRMVIVPVLDEFPKYAASSDPAQRKAAILALGNCAEGAPDFINTQLKSILPVVIQLLNDSNSVVRHASLVGLTALADEMPDGLAVEHDAILTALVKNLQAAMAAAAADPTNRTNNHVLRAVCGSFDSLANGLSAEKSAVLRQYALQLIEPMGQLLGHPDTRVKIAAAGAVGAIAETLDDAFAPYFNKTMTALGLYVAAEASTVSSESSNNGNGGSSSSSSGGGNDHLQLRSAVLDAIGRIALAVGAETFQPYVVDLMKTSEANLKLDDDRLKESSFIFWANMSKVYGREFKPFLSGVLNALLEALEGGDDDIPLQLTEEEKAIIKAGGLTGIRTKDGGKTIVIPGLGGDDNDDNDDDDDDIISDNDDNDDDDDEDAWAGMDSEAEEKEVAIEVLADVLANACGEEEMQKFLEKAVSTANSLLDHHYGGVRKAAAGLLWRSYARVWQLTEQSTGVKWQPGFPPPQPPTPLLAKLAEMVVKPTLKVWIEESERDVVTDINRNLAVTLQTCGPTILAQENAVQEIVTVLVQLITRTHPSQQDEGEDDGPGYDDASGSGAAGGEHSEYDWAVVETAMDVVAALGSALGPAFGELWKIFEKPLTHSAGANESNERCAAVGTIAVCVKGMGGAAVTPYTMSLLRLLGHRLSDEDRETKSNAAFAVGLVASLSTDTKTCQAAYPHVLEKLEQLLGSDAEPGVRLHDNAASAVCRMITAHPDWVPIDEYLPVVVERLPLKEDFEENQPIYSCIYHLYEHNEPTVQQLTPQLLNIFAKVLSPPEEQLDDETRALLRRTVQLLHGARPELFAGQDALLKLAQA
ncbi:hypothetical protein SCUCBS95973_004117 [Sporothrix curviconia]|uniref:Importin N-terminal domain-containing protein n=1 Tax=Sporothrix curviconia TaxID=1260050 RepID=A0ABP0BKZ9_9PEZI